jgi:nucleotide-binding universal stress UspA family protein
MGPPKRWRGEIRSMRQPSSVQKVAMLAPSSVLTVRGPLTGGGFLLCTDGTAQSAGALRRGAVLAHCCGEPASILAVAKDDSETAALERKVKSFKADLEARGITVDDATVAVGDPVPAIIEAGKSKSVIVVSDSGKSKITRFLVGSVAFDVMGKSETSVLNVR